MHRQIAVLVVDDSVVVRRLVTMALGGQPDITVVGTASNGKLALNRIDQFNPDVVTLDIEMPEMDGITTIREIRKTRPLLPVIMFSTLTTAGATATLDALAAGASDYVTKPANVGSIDQSMQSVREQLLPRIRALATRRAAPPGRGGTGSLAPASARGQVAAPPRPPASRPGGLGNRRVDVLAVGCSTGGPEALSRMLAEFPASFPVPVVVVQHMPPVFTRMFAERLDRSCAVTVHEASSGMPLAPGHVYLAPGDQHLEVVRDRDGVLTRLHEGPPEHFCRPAVDVLFRSVATAYRGSALAVVLTGMGQDGRCGVERLRAAGAAAFVQDEATSVVWGMPGAVAEAGLAEAVLPIDQMARAVQRRLSTGRAPVASLRGPEPR